MALTSAQDRTVASATKLMLSATVSCGTNAYRHGFPPYVAACADAFTHHSSAA
jgi:hypothetical protein